MDVGSPKHLEKLRDDRSIKAALFAFGLSTPDMVARFERAAKNGDYWPPIDDLSQRFTSAGAPRETSTELTIYGQPCWLVSALLVPRNETPFVIAMVGGASAPSAELIEHLRQTCHDYWYGSYFWK